MKPANSYQMQYPVETFVDYPATPTPTPALPSETGANSCPNVLLQKGDQLVLYNSVNPKGTDPKSFNDLDEYIEYYKSEKKKGSPCNLLYLTKTNTSSDATPAATPIVPIGTIMNNTPQGQINVETSLYPGFDSYGHHNGVHTKLDTIHEQTEQQAVSDNPMDTNWGGVEYTKQVIDSGKYDDYNISRPRLFNIKSVQFNPAMNGEGPQDLY